MPKVFDLYLSLLRNRYNQIPHFRYIQHYSKWLPQTHYLICDVEFAMAQSIGSEDPNSLQELPAEKLQTKIKLCTKLLKIFNVIATGYIIKIILIDNRRMRNEFNKNNNRIKIQQI